MSNYKVSTISKVFFALWKQVDYKVMAKRYAFFDNRAIRGGEISLAITKQVKQKDNNLYSTTSYEYLVF